MKNIKTILLAVTCLSLVSFTLNNSSIFQENLENVGVIKQSLLKPIQFNKTQKGTWVLLNGQEINNDSELFKLLEENFDLNILTKKDNKYFLPNASGAFIRSNNVNGEGFDPKKDRRVGSIQYDTIKNHKHKYEVGNAVNGHGYNTTGGEFYHATKRYKISEFNMDGSSETRPINISMYTYIKISN